jgi:phosphoglycerate dehydrogenase-like enzyme
LRLSAPRFESLSLLRRIQRADQSLREGRWEKSAFLGSELKGRTLGVVGLGRIHRENRNARVRS